jgi:hypothetical protein
MAERRPSIVLGSPAAILLAGFTCLLTAGLLTVVITYQGARLCYFSGCPDQPLQYIAYPPLYIGWILLAVGACALAYGLLVGQSRPPPWFVWPSQVDDRHERSSFPGVEEPAFFRQSSPP